jgi:SnoaL-like protein
MTQTVIDQWHQIMKNGDVAAIADILADDVVFHSPVVHTPQEGKAITHAYLAAANKVLGNDSFQYVREVIGETDAVLEFTLALDGIQVNGVDIIHWNDEGKIVDFKVMVRPLKAINQVHMAMGRMLEEMQAAN